MRKKKDQHEVRMLCIVPTTMNDMDLSNDNICFFTVPLLLRPHQLRKTVVSKWKRTWKQKPFWFPVLYLVDWKASKADWMIIHRKWFKRLMLFQYTFFILELDLGLLSMVFVGLTYVMVTEYGTSERHQLSRRKKQRNLKYSSPYERNNRREK